MPASVAQQNSRGNSAVRKNAIRASKVKNWSTPLRSPSVVVAFAHFFLFFSIQNLRLLSPARRKFKADTDSKVEITTAKKIFFPRNCAKKRELYIFSFPMMLIVENQKSNYNQSRNFFIHNGTNKNVNKCVQ